MVGKLAMIMFGKSGWMKTLERSLQINELANSLLIVSTNLDGFSLVNHG